MRIVVPNLLPGQLYNLQFRSKNDTETSAWSRTWQIQAAVDTIAPKTPTGLVVKTSGDSFVSNWDAVTENEDGSPALDLSHYLVKIRNLANNDTTVQKVFTNEFELTFNLNIALFDPLAASIAVSVASVDAVGNVSAYTDEVTATNPAPGPVRNLVANGVIEGIDITWEPPANLEDDFKEYQVFIGNDPEFEINSTNMVWQGISTSHLYQTTTITPLYVKVVAVDKFNSRSTVVTAGPVTPRSAAEVDTDAPDTPTNLAGTITGTSMTVTWTAPANPDNDLAGYTIQYRKVGETTWSSQNATHEDTSVVIPVEFQKDYQIRISAFDFSFNRSGWSTIVNVAGAVNTAPATPTGLQIRGAINSAMVVWNKNTESDLKEYEVQFEKHTPTDADEIYTTAGSNMSFVENVTTNTTYYARIRSVDTGGLKSAWSSVVSGTVGFVDIPDVELSDGNPPANSPVATATGGFGSIFLQWPAIANNDKVTYEIHLGTTAGFTPAAGTKVGESDSTFTTIHKGPGATALVYGQNYYVKLIAKDVDGAAPAGAASNAVQIVKIDRPDIVKLTDGLAPASSPAATAMGGFGTIFVNWNPVSNADPVTYEVHLSTTSGFTPAAGTKVGETTSTFTNISKTGAGAALAYGTNYYVRIIAKDADGAAAPGTQSAATQIKKVGLTDTTNVKTDGAAPANSPVATLTGSIKSLHARWTPVTNADPVTYEVHLGTTTGFTPGAGTLVGQTTANFTSITKLPDGTTDLAYDTDYYIKVIAKDADGAAAASGASNAARIQWVPAATDIDGISTRLDNTVKSYVIEYAVNSSETTAPTSGWSTSQPVRNPGQFIWFRTVITYGDNTTNTSSPALLTGNAGPKGDTGTGIASTEVTYQAHTSGTATPAGTWLPNPPATSPGQYLWTRTVTTFTDGTTVPSYSVAKHGETGAAGRGITGTVVTYAKNTSPTSEPTTGWSTNIPATTTGEYLWTRTVTSYTSGSPTTAYSVAAHGTPGADGVGVSGSTVEYAKSSNGTTAPTTGWSGTIPTTVAGEFLWTRTTINYTNGTSTTAHTVAAHGAKGDDGVGVSGTAVTYAKSSSGTTIPTSGWTSTIPTTSPGEYLWTRTITTYTDGSTTPAYSVARHGATGNAGVSITSVTPFYQQTLAAASAPAKPSGTTPPAPWTATEPNYVAGTALWRTERITYSSGSPSYTDVTKVSSYEAAAAARTIAITADNRVRSGTYAPGNAEKVDAPDGAIWHEYGAASAPNTGTVLKETWRLEGGNWVRRGTVDRTLVPLIDIGDGTFGSLSGGRLVANSVGADQINVNSLVGNTAWLNTLVTSQAFIDNAKIKTANIEGTLTIGKIDGLQTELSSKATPADVTAAKNEAIAAAAAAITNAENLIPNSSFEFDLQGWSAPGSPTVVTTESRGGTKSVRFSGTQDVSVIAGIPVSEGQVYRVGMFYKTSGAAGAGGLRMLSSTNNGVSYETFSGVHKNYSQNANWTELYEEFTIPAGVTHIRPRFAFALSSGSVWVDDVYLKDITEAKRLEAIAAGVEARALSRGTNLVTNGTGYLGTNYNFTTFSGAGTPTFDASDAPPGANGSFKMPATIVGTLQTDEFIPIDSAIDYQHTFWIRQQDVSENSRFYAMVMPYDAFGNVISTTYYMWVPGTTTQLAQPLNPGDTVVHLNSVANYFGSAAKPAGSSGHLRRLTFWDYVDPGGKLWPRETYSRNQMASNSWADGAVNPSNNTITLSAPYSGPAKPAGTWVSNGSAGSNYPYMPGTANAIVPKEWTRYSATFKGGTLSQTSPNGSSPSYSSGWPPGTAQIKLAWFINYGSTGADSTVAVAGVSFSDAVAAQSLASDQKALTDGWRWNGTTEINGGTIRTGTVKAQQIDVQNLVGSTAFLQYLQVGTANIVNAAITDAKIANLAVTNAKIANLDGDKILANTITAGKINVASLVGDTAWLNTLVTSQAFIDRAKFKFANVTDTLTVGQLPAQAALESDVIDARNEAMRTSAHVGILQPSIDLAGQHLVGGWGVAMQTTEPVHIGAATVRADGAGSRTFYLRENNGAGTVLETRTFTLAPGDNRINLDLYLTPGTYALTTDSVGPLIWRSSHSSISYPYDSGAFKIIGRAQHGASTIDNTTYFYFFYDMEVAGAGVNGVPIKWRASSDKTTIHGGNIETGTIKADSIDTDSLLADTAFITDLVSTQAFITNLEVTTANITDLTFDKIEGGQGIITSLDIKNTLTVDTGGIIQSANYSSSAGYRLSNSELIINQGTIKAGAIQLQIGQNLVPVQYADFEFPAASYGHLSTSGGNALIITTGSKFNKQHLRVDSTSNDATYVYLGTSSTDYNIPVEAGQTYIMSAYFKGTGAGVTTNAFIFAKASNGTNLQAASRQMLQTDGWTRVSAPVTIPAGVTGVLLFLYSSTASSSAQFDVDGIQFEQQTSSSTTPSAWQPGTNLTSIDGDVIRTGEIRSNVLNSLGQPQWSLNKDGGMQIGTALIRGTLTVGNTTGENSWVQSATYLPGVGGYGWRINADGSAEFQNVRIGRDSVVEGSLSANFITAGELKANISIGTQGKITAGSATQFSQLDNAGFKFWNIDVEDGGSNEAPMIALGPGDNFLNILVPDPDTTLPDAPPVAVGFGADGTMSALNAYVARDAVFDGAVHFNQGDLPDFLEGSYGPFINGKHLIDRQLTNHFETHPGLGEQNAWTLGLAYGIVGRWRRPFGSAGFPTPNSSSYRRELVRATFEAQHNRVYRVQLSAGPIQRDGGSNTRLDWGKIRLRSSSTAGSGVAWDTGTLVNDADLYLGGGQGEWISPQGYVYLIGGVDIPAGTVNLLTYIELFAQVSISWGSTAFCDIVVEDVGRWSSNFVGGNPTGVHHGSQSGGGSGGGTVAKEYTKTYTSNATAVFAGTTRVTNATWHKNRLRSGRGGSSTYNSYAYFDDAQIRSDIGSGTITKVEIYLYYQGNYPTGDAYVGLHNGSSPGSSPPSRYAATTGADGAGSRWRFRMGKGRWITIHNANLSYNNWKTGTYRGIYVGLPTASSDTIMDFHSHYSGNKPKIRITYRK